MRKTEKGTWKALDEIYQIYIPPPLSDLKDSARFRHELCKKNKISNKIATTLQFSCQLVLKFDQHMSEFQRLFFHIFSFADYRENDAKFGKPKEHRETIGQVLDLS